MKTPRDISSILLINRLKKFGYEIAHQTGRHIRLVTYQGGLHKITIPNHDPIKIGTLSSILSDIADHFKMTKKELLDKLLD
jgi:predicted RNA binding protein YcfA (HicA-like mRNA interferase family)